MERYVCIHAHFYQPPRENPWLEAIELQDSAEPYHDWNERVSAECYKPNATARILGSDGRIQKIVNNYASISFNFGPTLLSWMEEKSPDTYTAILEADRQSRATRSGHGNAIAQVYNHMIMPLSNARDQRTQALWGLRDFQKRFARDPEGMWLAETGVDIDSLEALADNGIKFTILAQHQARGVRKLGQGGKFRNVEGSKIDPTRAYVCKLPSGRTVNLFFYDGPISQAVAFEGLLRNGEDFAKRILGGLSDTRDWPQLMNIATDGETYGHHHRYGEMALAYAMQYIESNNLARLTNYGEYLEKHPATHEVEIINNTSWSCAHGVERWRSDCGCNSGMRAGWSQNWRAPLRASLDSLRDDLAMPYETEAAKLLKNPWAARDAYIDVILDRSTPSLSSFFEQHATHHLDREEETRALQLLEMQRHALLMYTSCGWFFDELSGLETVQVIMYAGRALQLAQEVFRDGFEQRFLEQLREAPSNVPEYGNGENIYERWVKPAQVDLLKVAAHYAISSLFDRYDRSSSIFCYNVDVQNDTRSVSGRARLALGRACIRSRITLEQADVTYGVLHFGDHNISAGVRRFRSEPEFQALESDSIASFQSADLPATIRILDRHFEGVAYSLRSLFKDERRKVLREILRSTMEEVEAAYRQIYEHHASLMDFFGEIGSPLPSVLRLTSEFVLNARMRRGFDVEDPIPVAELRSVLQTAKREQVPLGTNGLPFVISRRLNRISSTLPADPDVATLEYINEVMALVQELPFEVDIALLQNRCYEYLQTVYQDHFDSGEEDWVRRFVELCDRLRLQLPQNSAAEIAPIHAA
jgi:alpha-amylase/alpha-mannosidase (GH57 family)